MLCLKSVEVSYNHSRIVQNVSFTVNQGEKVCLMGRNGVGKTTLLKSIMGIQPPRKGKITLDDRNITNFKTYKRSQAGIAYVPQGREIIPMLTVRENLEIGCIAHTPKETNELISEVLDYFPALNEHLPRKGGVLSGGQQQQLAIARALMSKPKILLLDEPSEGIQPNVVADIANTLNKIQKKKNISILLIEQNLDFAYKVADSYHIMEKGSIVKSGELQEENIDNIKSYLTI